MSAVGRRLEAETLFASFHHVVNGGGSEPAIPASASPPSSMSCSRCWRRCAAFQPSATLSPAALKEISEVEAEIDRIEAQTLERLTAPANNEVQQAELLRKAMLYDKQLSVNRNATGLPFLPLVSRCRSSRTRRRTTYAEFAD
jgi:hypothetical protein